jgi:hypothetical protein
VTSSIALASEIDLHSVAAIGMTDRAEPENTVRESLMWRRRQRAWSKRVPNICRASDKRAFRTFSPAAALRGLFPGLAAADMKAW